MKFNKTILGVSLLVVFLAITATAFALNGVTLECNGGASCSEQAGTNVQFISIAQASIVPDSNLLWVKLYRSDGALISTQTCLPDYPKFCTLVKAHTETTPGIYSYYVQAKDDRGYISNSPVVSTVTANFLNNPPGAPVVDVTPNNPLTGNDLTCTVTQAATDPDPSDTVQYRYEWYKDGSIFTTFGPTAQTSNTIGSTNTLKGENWKCVVTSYDGEDYGGSDDDSVEIGNTAPEVTGASLGPAIAHTDTLFTCTGSGASDPDTSDTLTGYYLFRDTGGVLRNWATGSTFSCNGAGCDKGDTITCQYKVNDGTVDSNIATSGGVLILNTAPTLGSVLLSPATTYKADTLTATSSGAGDLDGDSLTYWYQFRDNDDTTVLQDWSNTNTFDCSVNAGCETGDTMYVHHKVKDNDNAESNEVSASRYITNRLPSADAGGPYAVDEGTEVAFDGSGSSDAEGPLTYDWDFSYDGVKVNFDVDATGVNPKNTWNDDYSATIALRVTDSFGDTDIDTTSLTVNNVDPSILTTSDTGPVNEGSPVNVTVTASDVAGSNDPLTYSFDWDNDGVYEIIDQAIPTAEHIFMDNGIHTVWVMVRDDDGGTDIATEDVTVYDLGPTAGFTFPSPVEEGQLVQFTDTSVSYPDNITSWDWNFHDGGTSTLQNPTHTFLDNAGAQAVTLTITDEDGSPSTITHHITITDKAPNAHFTCTPSNPEEGQPVQFLDNSSSWPDALMTWHWDFGDGNTSHATNPTHTFQYNGTYTIVLTVTDDDTTPDTYTEIITVGDTSPTASFTDNAPQAEGTPVQFVDSSTAYDGIVSWFWDFGDSTNSTTQNPSYAYDDNGIYTVSLTVTDSDGSTATIPGNVTITNANPSISGATFNPDPGVEGSPVNLTITATDPSTIDAASLTYSFDWNSDGTYEIVGQASDTASSTWNANGTKFIRVKVEDKDSGFYELLVNVLISDLGPAANFNFTPSPATEGQPVQFTDLSASNPDTITSWYWEFGDGGTGTTQNPSYTYLDNSVYSVRLTVTDSDGSTNMREKYITVNDINPTASLSGPSSLNEGDIGSFDASGSSGNPADMITLYEWDWNYSGAFNPSGDTGMLQNHSFMDNGNYIVALMVTDEDSSDITTLAVSVADLGPTADFHYVPLAPNDTAPVQFTDDSISYPDTIASWFWDFGDSTNSTVQHPTHLFANGTWNITLTVTDDDGSISTTIKSVTVSHLNFPPSQPGISPLSGVFGGDHNIVHITCSGSVDPNGDDVYYSIDAYYNGGWTSLLYQQGSGVFDWDVSGLSTQSGVQLRCNATDKLEDSAYNHSGSLSIDNDAPTTSINFTSVSWQSTFQSITLAAVDSGDAGHDTILYCVDQADTCTPGIPYTAPFLVSAEGENYVRFHANDTVGNTEPVKSQVVRIDTQAPTTSDGYTHSGDWMNSDQTITLTQADPSPSSGLAWTRYCTTAVCDPASGTDYTTPVGITSEGTTYFRYASADLAGNVQATVELIIMIDKTAPLITDDYTHSGIWVNSDQNVSLAPDATGGSPIITVRYCTGTGCDPAAGTVLVSPYMLTFDTEEDATVRLLSAKDPVGQTSTQAPQN